MNKGYRMFLPELESGKKAKIIKIHGDKRYLTRVTAIGLSVGCRIEMLQNVKKKPLLIYGRDTMIALDRRESENIEVEVEA